MDTEQINKLKKLLQIYDITDLPQYAKVNDLPTTGGLYFLEKPNGELVYVGKANSFRARLLGRHHVYNPLEHKVLLLSVSSSLRAALEVAIIGLLCPVLNGSFNPDRLKTEKEEREIEPVQSLVTGSQAATHPLKAMRLEVGKLLLEWQIEQNRKKKGLNK